jgi:hypothetical protein
MIENPAATITSARSDAVSHNAPTRRERRTCALLVALCVVAYLPALIGLLFGAMPFAEDALSLFGPWREWSRQALWSGHLPLWNPHIFGGLPFMGNGQASVLYLPSVVYWLLPVPVAFVVDALFHNCLLALGGYALARALGQSRTAAFVVGSALALGGAVSAHINTGHFTWHAARAYIPWELWALLLYLRSGQRRYAVALAIVVSLQVASGYPPMVLLGAGMCIGLFIAYVVSHLLRPREESAGSDVRLRGASRGASNLPRGWISAALLALVLIVALSAVFVLPLRETSKLSVHGSGLDFRTASGGSGTWRSIVRLFVPDFFGGNQPGQWSMRFGAWEEAAYSGLLVVVLALGAPLLARRTAARRAHSQSESSIEDASSTRSRWVPSSRAVAWLWALLPCSLLVAMGANTPVYRWLFEHVVFFRLTRVPVRWLEVWAFCVALLAGFAFDAVLHRARGTDKARNVQRALGVVCVALALLIIALFLTPANAQWWMARARALAGSPIIDAVALEITSNWRATALIESLIAFAIAALGAVFLARWQRDAGMKRRRAELMIVAVIVLDVLVLFWKSARVVSPQTMSTRVSWPQSLTTQYNPSQRWMTHIDWDAFNGNLAHGIHTFDGYDALGGHRYYDFISELEGREIWAAMYQPLRIHPLLRVAGVSHLLSYKSSPSKVFADHTALHPLAQSGDWKLWRHDGAWPRVYLSRNIERLPQDLQLPALTQLAAVPQSAQAYPVVVVPGAFATVAAGRLRSQDRVLKWTRTDNTMTTLVQTAAPSLLVQSETLYPGWRAWVNGRPAALQSANFLFRAVEVPAGRSRVDVVYDTQTFRFGSFVSICGLAAVACIVAAWKKQQKRDGLK